MNNSKQEELGNKHFDLLIEVAYNTRQINEFKKEIRALEKENSVKMQELDGIDLEMERLEANESGHVN
jgi:hypothetical protein